jgi:hypothetical protein
MWPRFSTQLRHESHLRVERRTTGCWNGELALVDRWPIGALRDVITHPSARAVFKFCSAPPALFRRGVGHDFWTLCVRGIWNHIVTFWWSYFGVKLQINLMQGICWSRVMLMHVLCVADGVGSIDCRCEDVCCSVSARCLTISNLSITFQQWNGG